MKRFLPFVFLTACLPPAPHDEDTVLHTLWDDAAADDQTVQQLLQTWHALAGGDKLTDNKHGSITKLALSEVDTLPIAKMPDLSKGRGFFFFGVVDCALDQMEQIFCSTDQATLFPDTYDAFSREYTSDFDAYVAHKTARLSWQTKFTDTVLDRTYDMTLQTQLRSVPGELLIAHTYQPEPASFHSATDSQMDQDFHPDAYYPRADGQLMHVYAMWGRAQFGIFSTDSDLVVGVMLGNLSNWDRIAGDLCKKGYGRPGT